MDRHNGGADPETQLNFNSGCGKI